MRIALIADLIFVIIGSQHHGTFFIIFISSCFKACYVS